MADFGTDLLRELNIDVKEWMRAKEPTIGMMPEVTVTAEREPKWYDIVFKEMERIGKTIEKPVISAQEFAEEIGRKVARPPLKELGVKEKVPETAGQRLVGGLFGAPVYPFRLPGKILQMWYPQEQASAAWGKMIHSPIGSEKSMEGAKEYMAKRKEMEQRGILPEQLVMEATLDIIWASHLFQGAYNRLYAKKLLKDLYKRVEASPSDVANFLKRRTQFHLGKEYPSTQAMKTAQKSAWTDLENIIKGKTFPIREGKLTMRGGVVGYIKKPKIAYEYIPPEPLPVPKKPTPPSEPTAVPAKVSPKPPKPLTPQEAAAAWREGRIQRGELIEYLYKSPEKDIMTGGVIGKPGFVSLMPIVNIATKGHDWLYTFGEMNPWLGRPGDKQMYNALMSRFSRANAAVEKAVSKVDKKIGGVRIPDAEALQMSFAHEDKTYLPQVEHRDVYESLSRLNLAIEKAAMKKGIFERPFYERMIDENKAVIQSLIEKQRDMSPTSTEAMKATEQIVQLKEEITDLENMRYLPHQRVVRRVVESKLENLKGEERKTFVDSLRRLSGKYRMRKGRATLKEYLDAGIIKPEDANFVRLTTENLINYYKKSAMQDLYDVAKQKGYIRGHSARLIDEGWYTPRQVGISAPELRNKVVHPLFANALDEMVQLRTMRGGPLRQMFGAVKISQFIKPSILWFYDGVQKYMRGMYVLNPITNLKHTARAVKAVMSKDALYHELNEKNLYQFPAETPRATQEEAINMFARRISADVPGLINKIESITGTSWAKSDIDAMDILLAPIRAIANAAWHGDKIIRTTSVLDLEKMGYPRDEAVRIAAHGHGGYSLLSPRYKKIMGYLAFVHSFRVLMPVEMAKIAYEPTKGVVEAAFKGKKIPKHDIERWVKAIIGTIAIPTVTEVYMRARGFETDKLGWKWKKTVTDPETGEEHDVVIALNNILNMPLKWYHRMNTYDPINPMPKELQGLYNLIKWELHPIWRMSLDVRNNYRSTSDYGQVYDPNAPSLIQWGQIFSYIMEQSFRHIEYVTKGLLHGTLSDKERAKEERILDEALGSVEKWLLGRMSPIGVGYAYARPTMQEIGRIQMAKLEKEYYKRLYNIDNKYDGVMKDKMRTSLDGWYNKVRKRIETKYGVSFTVHPEDIKRMRPQRVREGIEKDFGTQLLEDLGL